MRSCWSSAHAEIHCVVQVAPGDAPPAEPPAPHEADSAESASEDASAREGDSIREPEAADATVSPAPEPAPDHQARLAFTAGLGPAQEPALHTWIRPALQRSRPAMCSESYKARSCRRF